MVAGGNTIPNPLLQSNQYDQLFSLQIQGPQPSLGQRVQTQICVTLGSGSLAF